MKRKKARLDPYSRENLLTQADTTFRADDDDADTSSSEGDSEAAEHADHSKLMPRSRGALGKAHAAAGASSHVSDESRAHSVGDLKQRLTERMQHIQSSHRGVVQRGHKAGRRLDGGLQHEQLSSVLLSMGSSSSSAEHHAQHAALGEDEQIEEWERALQQAGGVKSKKTSSVIKKVLRRQRLGKTKGALGKRMKSVAKSMAERHEKRRQQQKELAARKAQLARSKLRAGFEGKRSSFL